MYQTRRTGLNHSKSLPWLSFHLKISSLYSPLVSLHLQQYSYPSNNQYCQPDWRGFVDEK